MFKLNDINILFEYRTIIFVYKFKV